MMKLLSGFSLLAVHAYAFVLPHHHPKGYVKPAYFLLAGDSTTALQNAGGGGWGAGFLNDTLRAPASGKNYGHDGATTVSFRAGGDWGEVLDQVESHKDIDEVFVTIQVCLAQLPGTGNSILTFRTVRPQRPEASCQHLPGRIRHQPWPIRRRRPHCRRNTHPRHTTHTPCVLRRSSSYRREPGRSA